MANFVNKYNDMTAYNADSTKQYPNTSKVVSEGKVLFQREDPADLTMLIVTYDVTSTENATKLLYSNTNITYQIIDGVQQQSVQMNYTFDTLGEHTVKYKLVSEYINCSFNGCTSLTSMMMPNHILQINSSNFCYGCTSLTNVKLSDNLNYIQDASFYGCSSLTDITIPIGVTFIGGGYNKGCFQNCSSLTSVTVKATTPPSLYSNVFKNTNANLVIYVPSESVAAYQAAANWSTYADRIQAIPTT